MPGEWPRVVRCGDMEIVSHASWCPIEMLRQTFPGDAALILPEEWTAKSCRCHLPPITKRIDFGIFSAPNPRVC